MGVKGEINLAESGSKVSIHVPPDYSLVDIKIGDSFWIILSEEQAKELLTKLKEEIR